MTSTKKEVAERLLDKGSLFVHLDATSNDVTVPLVFKHRNDLVLQIAHNMPIPVRDLDINNNGIKATLSFNRQPFTCFIAWNAVYQLAGDHGDAIIWPVSIPKAIKRFFDAYAQKTPPAAPVELMPAAERALQVLTGGLVGKYSSQKKPIARVRRKLPPYMRVIK